MDKLSHCRYGIEWDGQRRGGPASAALAVAKQPSRMVAAAKSKEARQRLKVLEETTDGFRIAEADLRLRGPGELLGQQQSGAARFRFGDLSTDGELIEQARQLAAEMVND